MVGVDGHEWLLVESSVKTMSNCIKKYLEDTSLCTYRKKSTTIPKVHFGKLNPNTKLKILSCTSPIVGEF